MDIERPHRTTSTPTTTSELFICFTSRLSKSSSMRLSSKSILSPGRAATSVDKTSHSLSLSSSLSSRLRHNGSLRGGAQSPAMFPSSSKKNKGSSGFADNPEPSSPKVTCIGQVRVKTKKQGKKMKMRACRSKRLSGGGGANGSGGESSFRRIEHSHSHSIDGVQTQQGQQECGLNHRNQRWVHLPLTICEALRAFGSEFSCLFPCKSSCFSSGGFCGGGEKGKTGEERENPTPNSCAVFRWLVSLQDGEGGEKRRDIELVVGGEEEVRDNSRVVMMERECSRRRSIFDDMEFDDLFTRDSNNNVKNDDNESNEIVDNGSCNGDDEEGGRVSVCVPPKNALLLMRCRSDPLKMASLSRKLWEVPLPTQDDEDVDAGEKQKGDEIEAEREVELAKETEEIGEEKTEEFREENSEVIGEEADLMGDGSEEIDGVLEKLDEMPGFTGEELKEAEEEERETEEEQSVENRGIVDEEKFEDSEETLLIEDEIDVNGCLIETSLVEEKVKDGENEQELGNLEENEQDLVINSEENEGNLLVNSENNEHQSNNSENNEEELKVEKEELAELELDSDDLSTVHEEEERQKCESSEISTSSSYSLNSSEESTAESKDREDEQQQEQETEKDPVEVDVEEHEHEQEQELVARKSIEAENKKTLPDCLLLMMCEPKVSMEVSKETWVCSTDFLRWLPERHHKKAVNKPDNSSDSSIPKKNKPAAVAALPPPHVQQRYEQAAQPSIQPGRSSISFPAGGGSVANLIEQKLNKGGGGYEPFVLTRCKSAPLRSAAKTLPPEMACSLWGRENGRKLEPHRPATFGVGAAGVGF